MRVLRVAQIGSCLLLALLQPASLALANTRVLRCNGQTLEWDNEAVHLVGYSYYGLLGDRQFDAEAFLENLAAHNINFTRFFLFLPWPVDPGPNVLPFAKVDGKYDLRRFNDEFFGRLRALVKQAEQLGIVCQVCLFDRCGLNVEDRRAWSNNPFNAECNVNGLLQGPSRGYPPFCHSRGPIGEIQAAFIKKVVQAIGDRGNVIYEIINEPNPQLGPLPEWHAWVARKLRENLEGRLGSKVVSSSGAYDDDEIDLFSMHMAGSERHVAAAIQTSRALRKPVIFSDDGDMRCMFNPAVTRSSAERALQLGQHFEHLAYTITLQREMEKRPAARLDEIPGLCQMNLRTLSECSTPLLARPFVRQGSIESTKTGDSLAARIEHVEKARRIFAARSEDGGRNWLPLTLTVDGDRATTDRLPYRQKARNLVRIVCIDKQSRRWPGPVFVYGPPDRWSIRLGNEIVEAGLIRVRPYMPDGVLHRVRRGGQSCYEVDLQRRGKFAYFRLDGSFARKRARGTVRIVIEYFDQPVGAELQLEYDGSASPYTAAPPVLLEGSGTWKSASFTIRNAHFQGRQNDGADLRFSIQGSAAPLALRSINVERPPGGPSALGTGINFTLY